MNHDKFYATLFAPLEASIGPIDPETITAILGFDAGGPLNFCTIGRNNAGALTTYVSCELAVRGDQIPAAFGRYELLASCNDEQWVRSILTSLARATMSIKLGHRHTLDIGAWVAPDHPIQGLILEREAMAVFEGTRYGVMRLIGVTRSELEFAVQEGVPKLLEILKAAGIYPNTDVNRKSVL